MVVQREKSDTYLDNTQGTNSRYRLTAMHIDEQVRIGSRRFGTWARPPINTADKDSWIKHTVTDVDKLRLDNISYQYYNRVDYWWAIASVNEIKNPFEELTAGMILFIPPAVEIELALGVGA